MASVDPTMSEPWWFNLTTARSQDSLALAEAEDAAANAQKAKEAEQSANAHEMRAQNTLSGALTSARSVYVDCHRGVALAQTALASARRAAGVFRGRAAVRQAKRQLANAKSVRFRRQGVASERLATVLDDLAKAIIRRELCGLALKTAQQRAQRADNRLRPRARLPILVRLQQGNCGICGESLPPFESDIEVDHIKPRHHGGTDRANNLQAAHARCNLRKGTKWEGTMEAQVVKWARWKVEH